MSITVFYSWQTDIDPKVNRNFIKSALEKAVKAAGSELQLEEVIRVDQDTDGVSGSPDILATIFQKIDDCAVFVADLTYVGVSEKGNGLPNPNVLTERGYALNAAGSECIIGIMNEAYGKPENLPFDLRHIRWPIRYQLFPHDGDELRSEQRAGLAKNLGQAIRSVFDSGALDRRGYIDLSGVQGAVLEYLVKNSEGREHSYLNLEELTKVLEIEDPEKLERLFFKFQHDGLVLLTDYLDVAPELELHVRLDKRILGHDTVADAKALARMILDDEDNCAMQLLHERTGWSLRRFNPAVWYLLQFFDDESIGKTVGRDYPTQWVGVGGDDRERLYRFTDP